MNENLLSAVEQIRKEFECFLKNAEQQGERGTKAAGVRARKLSLELEDLLKSFRKMSLKA